MASQFEKEFEREAFLKQCDEEAMPGEESCDESNYEEEDDESDEYESSFVDDSSEDEFAGSGDDEWVPPSKNKRRKITQDQIDEDEEERQFIADLEQSMQKESGALASYSYDEDPADASTESQSQLLTSTMESAEMPQAYGSPQIHFEANPTPPTPHTFSESAENLLFRCSPLQETLSFHEKTP